MWTVTEQDTLSDVAHCGLTHLNPTEVRCGREQALHLMAETWSAVADVHAPLHGPPLHTELRHRGPVRRGSLEMQRSALTQNKRQ